MGIPRRASVVFALALATAAYAEDVDPRRPEIRRSPSDGGTTVHLEAEAKELFRQLLPFFDTPGPRPELNLSPDERADARADERATITLTRGLLRLCAGGNPPQGVRREEVTRTRIAFILSHELAHVAHRHPGLFGSGVAEAVERRADDDAVGALLAAGFDTDRLYLRPLLERISKARNLRDRSAGERPRQVRAAVDAARRHEAEWRLGWLLSVSGRFDEARGFYRSFASKYPSPSAMYALAQAQVLAAWRLNPCRDSDVLAWNVPLRQDPRAQRTPFTVRSFQDSCTAFRAEVRGAIEDLKSARSYAPARVAIGALRLMLADPSLDPTLEDGGVRQLGRACPEVSALDEETKTVQGDACHVSLLAQLEMSRTPAARALAIDGLRALRALRPTEPSLQYNLARLLTNDGRAAEAGELWAEFARHAAEGPYREEAEAQLRRIRGPAEATDSRDPVGAAALPSSPVSEVRRRACAAATSGTVVSLLPHRYLRQCGSWSDELVVRDLHGVLLRTVSASSEFWTSGAETPSSTPIVVLHDANGDVIRVWDQEAWVFTDGVPSRVVYFKRAS
jgi:hypothetical protein